MGNFITKTGIQSGQNTSKDTGADSETSRLPLAEEPWPMSASSPIPIKPSDASNSTLETDALSDWCLGRPSSISFLYPGHSYTPEAHQASSSPSPKLENLLSAARIKLGGHTYLLLSETIIRQLASLCNGIAQPAADMSLFERIIIDGDINEVHADDALAALECVGEHCRHLLVVSPVRTSELGCVFGREVGEIGMGNDWDGE